MFCQQISWLLFSLLGKRDLWVSCQAELCNRSLILYAGILKFNSLTEEWELCTSVMKCVLSLSFSRRASPESGAQERRHSPHGERNRRHTLPSPERRLPHLTDIHSSCLAQGLRPRQQAADRSTPTSRSLWQHEQQHPKLPPEYPDWRVPPEACRRGTGSGWSHMGTSSEVL